MAVALVTCQQSWEDCPGLIVGGVALNTTTCGAVGAATVTVTGALTVAPLAPVAVRVYVVVVVGCTVVLPFTGRVPETPLIDMAVAPVVVQLKVDCCPGA